MESGLQDGRATRAAVVVEDDADIRHLLAIVLGAHGFTVHVAVTGEEGRDLMDGVRPVLITLDLNLPDMDGRDLCSELRAMTDAHILTISARPPHLTEEQCLAAGSGHFMSRPFSPRVLGAYLDGVFPREGTEYGFPASGGSPRRQRMKRLSWMMQKPAHRLELGIT